MNKINNQIVCSDAEHSISPQKINDAKFEMNTLTKEEKQDFITNLADFIKNQQYMVRYNMKMYMFNNGIYQPIDKSYFRNMIFELARSVNVILNFKECSQVLNEAEIRTNDYPYIPNGESHTLFRNGFVDNNTGFLVNPVPYYFPTMRVEANYLIHPTLNHPETDRFLYTLTGGDPVLIKLFWQVIGYCISSDAMAKKIFVLYGESGDNGKSTFLSFLQSFITYTGIMSMSMKNLLGGRFALSELNMKRLEISTDEGTLNLGTSEIAVLKRISGHDIITADVKCKQQIQFLSTCKILIASNHNIGTAYAASDSAFIRRLCLLPFNVHIPREQHDPFILQKLEKEKDAVATEAMRHFVELRRTQYQFAGIDKFNNLLSFTPNGIEYELIRKFSDKYCNFSDKEAFVYTDVLYTVFCNAFGTIFKDITGFSQAFYRTNENRVEKIRKHTSTTNAWGFKGVILNGGSLCIK